MIEFEEPVKNSNIVIKESLPKRFEVVFKESFRDGTPVVTVKVNGENVGDVIDDNSYENDFYRYHDIFHYTFATFLRWSPCVRAMLKRKRKSSPKIDAYEDGARATITEEAISLMLFNEAKKNDLFDKKRVSSNVLKIIKEMTSPFEVNVKTKKDWEEAIYIGYDLFRSLIKNRGGKIKFDSLNKQAEFYTIN